LIAAGPIGVDIAPPPQGDLMTDQPPLDPKETLVYIKTLIRLASGRHDINVLRKLLKEMRALTDKALPKVRK
jgi:hypothetical protein